MANSIPIPRSMIIFGICLPLALILGYLLSDPLESSTLAVVVLVLSILSLPFLLRWHHAVLLTVWNSGCILFFLPGAPQLAQVVVLISLFFAVLRHALGQKQGFFEARSVGLSLVFLFLVAVTTAYLRGGIGLRAMGNSHTYGGRMYVNLFIGIFGYFALVANPTPPRYPKLWMAIFFLSAMAVLIGLVGQLGGHNLNLISYMFPADDLAASLGETNTDFSAPNAILRLGSLVPICFAVFSFQLAFYGLRASLNLRQPWRPLLLIATLAAGCMGGFRSVIIYCGLTLLVQFWLEGLHRTRLVVGLLAGALVLGLAVLPNATKLPLPIQRSLSFLPIEVDPLAREDALGSLRWRLDIWSQLLPEVPKYLALGKGYSVNAMDLMEAVSTSNSQQSSEDQFALTGDYHNGPLSVLIPFGLAGAVGFLWFTIASLKVLWRNFTQGDPSLKSLNTFLLASYVAHMVMFLFVVGALHSDLMTSGALVGLGVFLNRRQPEVEEVAETPELEAVAAV